MVRRVRPIPTLFPTSLRYTPGNKHPCILYQVCDTHGAGISGVVDKNPRTICLVKAFLLKEYY